MSDENFRKNVQALVTERTQRYSRQGPGGSRRSGRASGSFRGIAGVQGFKAAVEFDSRGFLCQPEFFHKPILPWLMGCTQILMFGVFFLVVPPHLGTQCTA